MNALNSELDEVLADAATWGRLPWGLRRAAYGLALLPRLVKSLRDTRRRLYAIQSQVGASEETLRMIVEAAQRRDLSRVVELAGYAASIIDHRK